MATGAVTQRAATEANMIQGRSKLAGGTVTVGFKQATDSTVILASGNDGSVTGILTIVITAGTGFTITSSVGGDTGFVGWLAIVNQQSGS